MRALLAFALSTAPALAAPLTSPRAEAQLACAAYLAWRADFGNPVEAADPMAQSTLFASAMAAEAEATGAEMLDLLGSLQDRMRLIQNAYSVAETKGFATLDGLAIRAEDLMGLETSCVGGRLSGG